MPSNVIRLTILSAMLLAVATAMPRPLSAATLNVTDLGDTVPGGATGQLRRLVNDAAPGDTIVIPAGIITLTGTAGEDANASGDVDIVKSLTIEGVGPGVTIIDGGGIDRVFQIDGAATVTISGVTIRNGNAGDGGFGGGIENGGILTLSNVTIHGNTAGFGGGIENGGTVTLSNVTISDNTADEGGGIDNFFGTSTLSNVTIHGNTAGFGGGVANSDTLTLQNTIVATQLAGPDCGNSGGTITSNGFNLDSDNTCQLTQPSDKPNVSNPLLGPLADNGGPTFTHALLPGSPAIDAVTSGCPPPATDERGVARPQGAACDIGAYEVASGSVARLTNLSTRAQVGLGADQVIVGVTIGGDVAKTLLFRALGGTLSQPPFDVPGALADPVLQIFPAGQIVPIAQNDNWMVLDPLCLSPAQTCGGPAAIAATGFAPPLDTEAAVLLTLLPGAYTAIVSGIGQPPTGVALVDVFEVPASASP